jgi:cell division FtsZ-interacting protein ZapD
MPVQGCGAITLLKPGAAATLATKLLKYPPAYDEALFEVRARLVAHGAATKMDLAALICWKYLPRSPWMQALQNVPHTVVRDTTAEAMAPLLSDQARIQALAPLPGFSRGRALASAFFTAWDPLQFGVQDDRALRKRSRFISPMCTCSWVNLPSYWAHLRELATELTSNGAAWTPRMVDMALYV